MHTLGLLVVILLTWQSVSPMYQVEVQRRFGQGPWRLVQTTTGSQTTERVVTRGRHCWRVRYVMPQRSAWTNLACVTHR